MISKTAVPRTEFPCFKIFMPLKFLSCLSPLIYAVRIIPAALYLMVLLTTSRISFVYSFYPYINGIHNAGDLDLFKNSNNRSSSHFSIKISYDIFEVFFMFFLIK